MAIGLVRVVGAAPQDCIYQAGRRRFSSPFDELHGLVYRRASRHALQKAQLIKRHPECDCYGQVEALDLLFRVPREEEIEQSALPQDAERDLGRKRCVRRADIAAELGMQQIARIRGLGFNAQQDIKRNFSRGADRHRDTSEHTDAQEWKAALPI